MSKKTYLSLLFLTGTFNALSGMDDMRAMFEDVKMREDLQAKLFHAIQRNKISRIKELLQKVECPRFITATDSSTKMTHNVNILNFAIEHRTNTRGDDSLFEAVLSPLSQQERSALFFKKDDSGNAPVNLLSGDELAQYLSQEHMNAVPRPSRNYLAQDPEFAGRP